MKKIFVNIEDCPNCIISELYNYRYNYLKEMYYGRIEQEKKLIYKFGKFIRKNIF